MKKILVLLVCVLAASRAAAQEDSLLIMFWNLENFFDFKDEGLSPSDNEFSDSGVRRWSKRRFYTKCNAVAKTILWTAGSQGRLPDIVGFAEIENDFVLRQLVSQTPLRKYGYKYVHFESQDHRGIDVGLIYNPSTMPLDGAYSVHIDSLSTRDILVAEYGSTAFMVNHHPSKFGGEEASRPGRFRVMSEMLKVCDTLSRTGMDRIVCMGDFNDTPDGEAFSLIEGRLVNKALPLFRQGEGTIRYEGRWELIDMFLVDPDLSGHSEMEILYPPFLLTQDKKHGGVKPLRTYSGPQYIGGVSDHLPVILKIH